MSQIVTAHDLPPIAPTPDEEAGPFRSLARVACGIETIADAHPEVRAWLTDERSAREKVERARRYFMWAKDVRPTLTIGVETVFEHGRGIRLAARWEKRDPNLNRLVPSEQHAYPRSLDMRQLPDFVVSFYVQIAEMFFHEDLT